MNPSKAITPGAFLGAHLRTSSDAQRMGWINYETQKDRYLNLTSAKDLSTIYVASGNPVDVKRFVEAAYPRNVVTKFDLLEGHEAAMLKNMTWDQQVLIFPHMQ
jgi:hypothetical protein